MHVTGFVTLAIWLAGFVLIEAATKMGNNLPLEIRLMYLLFVTLYIVLMMVLLCLEEIMYTLNRIENNRK